MAAKLNPQLERQFIAGTLARLEKVNPTFAAHVKAEIARRAPARMGGILDAIGGAFSGLAQNFGSILTSAATSYAKASASKVEAKAATEIAKAQASAQIDVMKAELAKIQLAAQMKRDAEELSYAQNQGAALTAVGQAVTKPAISPLTLAMMGGGAFFLWHIMQKRRG